MRSPVNRRRHPTRLLVTITAVSMLAALAGCSGSSLDAGSATGDTIRIGLMLPQSGPYKAIGDDLAKGWQLYLDTHGGKLGGHPVQVITADEAEGKQSALNAARKLLDKDKVQVIAGTGSADAVESIKTLVTEKKIPFVGTGGRPSTLTNVAYVWHTSWLSRETGQAIADHVRTAVAGPVYVIGPDYQGGYDQIGGFVDAFTKAGGKLANDGGKPAWTPWPATTNFLPYLNRIADTDAKAVYCFYAGTAAVQFVQQYAQAGLKGKIPLYAAGFLTEGSVLAAQGAAADGVQTVLNYAPNLDNAANRVFAPAYQQKHQAAPNLYNLTGYDAALVLDQAIAAAGKKPTSQSINTAIGKLGAIDSPRGQWRFGTNHSPIQPWYLRRVENDGRARANVVVQNLTTLGS
ncbi:ABC transporter substrate-binding protein [Micromonospora sp. STR1s_5]|nr:ABC transporter substrate-binding protein [Micromonospora sp. STR1s_5]